MHSLHTHYDNLKVTRDAPPEVIRAAYRCLCHKYHPDRHGGSAQATRTFQLITSAYEVLADPERRQRHDDWIASEESTALRWDGCERRRRTSAPAASRRLNRLADRLRSPLQRARTAAVMWTSAAAAGVILYLWYAG